jgi:hypothetical protein
MRRTTGVLSVLLLLLCAAAGLSAQDIGGDPQSGQVNGFQLDQNYPNPFNPETRIPFTLAEGLFVEGRPAVVSIRIFNILTQLVASPVALRHPSGQGVAVDQLEYTQPGRYEAYWDGNDQMGRQVSSGIYLMQLSVNGLKPITRKMYVMK